MAKDRVTDSSTERRARFAEAFAHDEGLDSAALLLGDWDDAGLSVAQGRAELDRIAALVRARCQGHPGDAANAIVETLFTDLIFVGNHADYYDPKNSFLGQVLTRRVGIPISLCVLTLEIARRLDVPAAGIAFPGHFLMRLGGNIIDPFHSGITLDQYDLQARLALSIGPETQLTEAHLAAVDKRAIIHRMLMNLAGVYGKRGDLVSSLEVLERLAIVDPHNAKLANDLDAMRSRVDDVN